jgi:hypothetical protein
VRKLPVLLAVLAAAVALVSVPMSIVWLVAGSTEESFTVVPGNCVRQAPGDRAVLATCGEAGTFTVVAKVEKPAQCTDPRQPFIENPTAGGRTEVLCLRPAS